MFCKYYLVDWNLYSTYLVNSATVKTMFINLICKFLKVVARIKIAVVE